MLLSIALMLTGYGNGLHAADPLESIFDEFRRQEKRNLEQRRELERTPDVVLEAPTGPPEPKDLPKEFPCFTIETIEIEGMPEAHREWALALVKPYESWCIGQEGINLLARKIQRGLLARGLVTTRVYVPPQDLVTAKLRLTVVAGVIRAIRFADPDAGGSWATAFPARPGDLLNLRDLEQGLEQLKRVPSQDVEMEIVPGERPGESDVVITRKHETPWRVFLTVDDSGSEATGELQGAVAFAYDNALGINDLFHATFNHDIDSSKESRGTRGKSLYYSWPQGYWTFSLGASEYTFRQTIQGTAQTFVSSGTNTQYEARVHRIVHRSQTTKTGLELRVQKRKLRSFVDDAEVLVQRRDVSVAEPALVHRQFLGRAVLDARLSRPTGVNWFDATDDPEPAGPDTPTNRYRLWVLDASLSMPFKLWGMEPRYSATLRAQRSQDRLFATEFFSIGNRYTVRGFDGEQTLAAERGWYIRNELSLPIAGSSHNFYFGLDTGAVSGPSADVLVGDRLTGAVLGLRGAWQNFNYDVFAGWPLSKPSAFETDEPAYGFVVTYRF